MNAFVVTRTTPEVCAYIHAHLSLSQTFCGALARYRHRCSSTINRNLANPLWVDEHSTNYLQGSVPPGWCKDGKAPSPNGCSLLGSNSLCLPISCTYNWCGLTHNCDVLNGHWSEWSQECSKTCGGGTFTRKCDNPAPKDGGRGCSALSTKACNTQRCPGMEAKS